jgi:hypothetical protein
VAYNHGGSDLSWFFGLDDLRRGDYLATLGASRGYVPAASSCESCLDDNKPRTSTLRTVPIRVCFPHQFRLRRIPAIRFLP